MTTKKELKKEIDKCTRSLFFELSVIRLQIGIHSSLADYFLKLVNQNFENTEEKLKALESYLNIEYKVEVTPEKKVEGYKKKK